LLPWFAGTALVMIFKLPVERLERFVEFLPFSRLKIPHFHFEDSLRL